MTPSVRTKEYSPSLAPKLAQQNWDQPNFNVAATPPPAGARPSTATATATTATNQQQQQQQRVALPKQLSPGSVKLFLPTAGDLFQAPDQDFAEGLTRDVCGTQLQVPGWNFTRPFLTGLHLLDPQVLAAECAADPPPTLAGLPPEAQEQQLVDDLLYSFMGYEGKFIKPRLVANTTSIQGPQLGFAIAIPLDPCLQEQLERLLPIPEYVAAISRFVETRSGPDHPLVAQALAAAMRGLLQQWQLLVVQLEHQMRCGGLSLAALVFHVQAPSASLALLAGIAVSEVSHWGERTSRGSLERVHLLACC
jgi:gamma-tubulin complex component 2